MVAPNDDVFVSLQAPLRDYAQRMLSGWPKINREVSADDLIHQAWLKLQGKDCLPEDAEGALRYLKTCILNHGRDLNRRAMKARMFYDSDSQATTFSKAGPLDRRDTLAEVQRSLRRVLELTREPWAQSTRIRYDAVFLLDLRLALSSIVGRSLGAHELEQIFALSPQFSALPELIEGLLAWTEEQGGRCVKAGWSPLLELWWALSGALAEHPHLLSASTLCELINASLERDYVRAATWHKWLERARDQALREYGVEAWREHFARWLGERGQGSGRGV